MKKSIACIFLVILLSTLTACSFNLGETSDAKQSAPPAKELVIKATGEYQGLSDNNFYEVKISNVPEDEAMKVFMITDLVRPTFEALELKKGDIVTLEYIKNKNGQLETQFIEKSSE